MSISSELWAKLAGSEEYRHAFVASELKRGLPRQIRILRNQRHWNQQQLASEAELTQGAISRAEDPDYGNLTLNNLLRIGCGLDVAFIGRFIPFSELARWYVSLSHESQLEVPSFDDDAAPDVKADDLEEVTAARAAAGATTFMLADLMKPSPEMFRSIEQALSSFPAAMREGPQQSTLAGLLQSLDRPAAADNSANSRSILPAASQPTPAGVPPDPHRGLHLVSFGQPPDRARMKAANPPSQAA
ncbi:MAG: helix-turn-helix domain-containing protein [Acidobacteria bacterium]|nr:helix-turn-helix domain-containing protein [Acidobacteriota bacterium]